MKWVKHGLIYSCEQLHQKLLTHSANPLPMRLDGDNYRIFFNSRDAHNRSSVGAVDIDLARLTVVREYPYPFFGYGDDSSFYSHGVSLGNVYNVGFKSYMLFMGWHIPLDGHWYGAIGRLEVHDDLTLSLEASTPFMGLDDEDPHSLSYPWVTFHDGVYKMWYGSTVSWTSENGEMVHVIKYAESVDGCVWDKKGLAIPYEIGIAQAFSRPSVHIDESGIYHMWYSLRSGAGEAYRVGYARSSDGVTWERLDGGGNGIGPSLKGWDSIMTEYPFVFSREGQLNMLYNGNGYGRSGFGLAKLSSAQ